jgi:transposase-like protein
MTETLAAMPPTDETPVVEPRSSATAVLFEEPSSPVAPSQRAVIAQLVKAARARGEELTGPDGLLKALTKTVLETALDEEMAEHLGYDKHAVAGRNGGNSRNGTRAKTVLTDNVGPVTIEVPRDRDGSFTPVIVKKRQRRLGDVDTVVLSLYAKGLTTGEISAHFAEVYGASLSKDRISVITDRVVEEMQAWCARPLLPVYAAVFIDAIYVKVRDGQVGNRPFYAAIGVDLAGHRDVLGLWAGTSGHGESAKFWMSVLTEMKNRGVADVFFIICDGLKGLPDSVNAIFPLATVQQCIIHLIRGTFRYASKKYWDHIARDLRPIYTAPSAEAAWAAFEEFEERWATPYPAISALWRDAWEQFTPFLGYDVEIRRVLCSTNAIESLNARYRRAVAAKGHFPSEQAALKTLYLVTRSLDPKGTGQARWAMRWKPALNAFAVTFADRMPAAENL